MNKKLKEMTRDELREYHRLWREENRDKIAAYNRKQAERNKLLGIKSEYDPELYQKNKEAYRKAHDEWVERNKEHVREYQRERYQFYRDNPKYIDRIHKLQEELKDTRYKLKTERQLAIREKRKELIINKIITKMKYENITIDDITNRIELSQTQHTLAVAKDNIIVDTLPTQNK